jgi:NADH-quinone oxidoreductase subunit C
MNASELVRALRERFPQAVEGAHTFRGDATVLVRRESLVEVVRALKEEPAFQMNFLMDLTAVDYSVFGQKPTRGFFSPSGVPVRPKGEIPDEDPWPGPLAPGRFAVVYHFYSLRLKHRLRIEVIVDEEDATVDSLTSLWGGANWLEREVWDMFGIHFSGHPDLRRILMYEEFEGHPLRKDYPVKKRQPLIGPVN